MYQLSDIRVHRGGRDILSIKDLTIPSDGFTVILGHNGSGKSTMVNLLAGQATPDAGKVTLQNKDGKIQDIHQLGAKDLAREVAFLPQKLPDVAGLTVRELVKMGRFAWRGVFGRFQKQDHSVIEAAMQKTDVLKYADSLADKLSGGERQRAWVSMLLAQESPVLILDEPTSALDVHHQYHLMDLLQSLNKETGCGVLVILHDINLALRYATHIVALKQGEIAFSGPTQTIQDEARLSELYQTPIKLIDHPTQAQKLAVVC